MDFCTKEGFSKSESERGGKNPSENCFAIINLSFASNFLTDFIPENPKKEEKQNPEHVQNSNVNSDGFSSGAKKISVFPQLIAAFAALVGAFSFGCALGFPAVAMPKLRQDPNFPQTTEDDISWMSAIITVGALCACAPTGFAVDKFGRRNMMQVLAVPFLAGWLLIYCAQSVFALMCGRFLTGFCGGSITLAVPIFIAETSEPKFRGMLINGFELMIDAGILFISVIGKFCDWRTQALVCSVIPLQALVILFFIPESPRFLLCKGREEKAFESLCWFRGTSDCQKKPIEIEFETMMTKINEDKNEGCSGVAEKIRELTSFPVLKSFFLILSLFFFEEFSGIAAVDSYTIDIFQSATIQIDPFTCCIIAHVVETLFAGSSGFLMDKINRKFLIVFSESIMTISLALMGAFFYLKEKHSELLENSLTFLPAVFVLLYYVGFASGTASVPLTLMSELLPQRVRGVASSLLLTLKYGMSFLVSRYFKNYMSAVGNSFGYFTFASICLLGLVFGLMFLPKTSGKSLEQIQIDINNKKNSKSSMKSALNAESQSPV